MTRSTREWERDFDARPAKTAFSAGAIILLVVLGLSVIGGAGFWALNLASQPAAVLTKTFDADNMIMNYEYFRDQYADIEGMQAQVANVAAEKQAIENLPRDQWSAATEANHIKLTTQLTGLQNKRIRMIQDYNANASKANRSIFMAGLPSNIPL